MDLDGNEFAHNPFAQSVNETNGRRDVLGRFARWKFLSHPRNLRQRWPTKAESGSVVLSSVTGQLNVCTRDVGVGRSCAWRSHSLGSRGLPLGRKDRIQTHAIESQSKDLAECKDGA